MALSIEQQRRYARMLTPEQLANYVKNPDMGNEIGITPSVFAEAIAEINAEDKEPPPVAPNTVMDRQVNEMLGGRRQFSHGGIIPGYQVGGHLGPTTPSNDFLQMVLNQPEIRNATTRTSAKGGLPRLVSQVFNKYNPYAWYLLAMLGLPEEVGYSDEDREAFLRRPSYPRLDHIRETQGMEAAERARKIGGYSTGHDDQGMDFDKPSIWERIKEMYQGPIGRASGGIITGYQNGGDVNPDKPLSTRELYEQRQKELGQAQGYSELDRLSTPGGTGVPAGWQAYVDLMQSGEVEEGLRRAWEGSGPVTESPSLLERMNLGEKYFGLQSSSPVDQGIITLEEMAKEQSATGDFGGVEGARLRELQDIPLTQKQQNLLGILSGQQGSPKSEKDDDIREGKKVAEKVEEGILVDVPDSNFADHITRIENLMDEPLKPEQQDLLDKLESRTAITDRISELEGSREGDYEEYLQNRFYNALANIARPGGLGASLSASDSAYSQALTDLENRIADLKMQGEAQDIDAARVAAEFSTLGDRYVPALLDAELASIQDATASARHAAELNLKRYEIQKTLEARIPTAIEQQFQLLDVLQKAKADEDLMLSDPNLKLLIDQRLSMLLPLLMGSVNIEAQDEE